jgi:glycosyltransferase involved in cell wall biosynthesis
MVIAVDKNTINAVKRDNEYIYIFDNEPLEELIKINLHCIHYKSIKFADINLTDYDIDCIKKASIRDEDYDILPEKIDYKFAIIIPNYNNDHGDYEGKTFLQNCIESVLNQTYRKFDLIIVDDLSTDGSVKTIEKYQEKDKRIHLIKNIRKRYNGGSRNVAIEYAIKNLDINYFCFLDSDDWWKDNEVLETINSRLYGHDMMLLGAEMLFKDGVKYQTYNEYKTYKDFFISEGKSTLWCTAWCRVIKKEKIVYFCEDTLMEDRVWSYRQADNVDIDRVINVKKICYVWNRTNITNSVSIVRNDYWNASAYCHIGHQLQLISQLKHKEMISTLQERVNTCKEKIKNKIYEQY